MYTLVIDATFKSGRKAEFLDYWKKEILPTQKEQYGFIDEILLFADKDPNQGLGLSFWESKEDAQEYYRKVFPRIAAATTPFCEKQPVVREYNVEVAETFDFSADKAA